MKKFVTYDKLSKKEKRKADSAKRKQWYDYGCLRPASRIVPDKKKDADKHRCRTAERYLP